MKGLRVLLFETPDNPKFSLAFEEALWRSISRGSAPPTLRFWRHRNAVIVGYFQRAEEEVNMEVAREVGAEVVRRFTGGGAVYHDLGDLLWTVATRGPPSGGPSYLYGFLLEGFVRALKKLGFDASLDNVNDVVVEHLGRRYKVSGTAGTFAGEAYLLHGTLLIDTDLELLSKILKVPRAKLADKGVSDVKFRVRNLREIAGRNVEYHEVISAVVAEYAKLLGLEPYFDVPSRAELEMAKELYERKYSKPEWNLMRYPHKHFE